MSHTPDVVEAYEQTTPDIDFDLVDKDGNPLPESALLTLTLTVKQKYTKAVVNGRDAQNVKDANQVTVTDGHAKWAPTVADTTMLNRALPTEPRWVHFRWSYQDGAATEFGDYEFLFNIHRREAMA